MTSDTIESLTGERWPAPGPEATSLETRATAARKVPIAELSPEHLRLLLGQRIDLDTVLPIAADRLAGDPLMSGDYYPGDVLEAALALGPDVWVDHPAERARLVEAVRGLQAEAVDDELEGMIESFLRG